MDLKHYNMHLLITLSLITVSCTNQTEIQNGKETNAPPVTPAFTSDIVSLPVQGADDMRFGIKNCEVYQAKPAKDEWELLFKPAPYPLPQQCVRERLEFDGKYIQIEIGTQALGAGGCCTNYAAYRSRDGANWEIRPATSITEWQPLDSVQ